MRFAVLGPMRVTDRGSTRPVIGARQRILLAALLAHASQPVSRDQLAEIVWDGAAPERAATTLRTYLMRLRRDLGPQAASRVLTRDRCYLVEVGPGEFDVLDLESLFREAGAAVRAADWAAAAKHAHLALALWRGTPLADVPSQTLRDSWLPRLDQQRVQLTEWSIEADLHLGRHEQLVPQLRQLIAEHPVRERFHAQFMQTLMACGRQAEALAAYQDARKVLVEELGIEPGPELRDLQARILAGDSDLAASAANPLSLTALPATAPSSDSVPVSAPVAAVIPRQLPTAARHFTGRREELEQIIGLLQPQSTDGAGGTVVICAIDGMAGVGKTALAVHVAHRLSERFPDGQLFIDLHGHTQGHRPREPGQALEWLLRALEVPAARIPEDAEARAALFRQRLAGTRTLIVLDNALDEAQVRPMLPGQSGCLVLVTSRRRLKGLDDARSLSLDLLPPDDAATLLRAVAGSDHISAEDPMLAEIVQLCGRLPLALRIAGALLRHRPAWSPEHLAGRLRDQRRRVASLSDGERDLSVVFDLSYIDLGCAHGLLFRRLGLLPGPDADAYAAAALLECDPRAATGLLEDLVDHNLLIAHAPGRYRLHDLMRAHAAALADTDPQPDRDTALDRLLHYYAHTAQTASDLIARYPRSAPVGPVPAHVPALHDPEAAWAWLRAERDNLEAAYTHARTHALEGHAVALAAGLAEILHTDGPYTRALELHEAATATAQRHGWPTAQATALADLALVRRLVGDLPGAGDALTRALEIFCAIGDRRGEAVALSVLGTARLLAGDLPGADDALTRALEIFCTIGDRRGEASALNNLGDLRLQAGDLPRAGDAFTRALEIYRVVGDRHGEAVTLNNLGNARLLAGDLLAAGDALTRALEIYRALSNSRDEAIALNNLGDVRLAAGDLPGADRAITRALEIFRAIGNRRGEASALNNLGNARRLAGDLPAADEALTQALEICRAAGHRTGEAYALSSLARVRRLAGDLPSAVDAASRALQIYRTAGSRGNEAWALNHYAAAIAATGDLPQALALYQQALTMNRELNKPDDEAASLEGIGECLLAAGDTDQGIRHLRHALETFRRLGMRPDAERVASRLANACPLG
jgi:DNA-binding SARP family transcriptional activator